MSIDPKRKRFIQDDSSHWYLIDADKVQAFEAWVIDQVEGPYHDYGGEDFEADRIAGPVEAYTFTDPKED